MNPQHVRSARLISVNSIQHALDKPLFEFADGFVEKYSAFQHLAD